MTGAGEVQAVWRIEGARIVATLARMTGGLGLAEDLAQEAIEQWPHSCRPANPGAWLTAVAKRRAIDGRRRRAWQDERYRAIARDLDEVAEDEWSPIPAARRTAPRCCSRTRTAPAGTAGRSRGAALRRAEPLRGPSALQAAVAEQHAVAPAAARTDWPAIVRLYDRLLAVAPNPVVRLNRAVAVGMADGPAAVLALVDGLAAEGRLAGAHLLPAVRGELLARAGRAHEAARALQEAAAAAANQRVRAALLARAAVSGTGPAQPS